MCGVPLVQPSCSDRTKGNRRGCDGSCDPGICIPVGTEAEVPGQAGHECMNDRETLETEVSRTTRYNRWFSLLYTKLLIHSYFNTVKPRHQGKPECLFLLFDTNFTEKLAKI